MQNTFRIGDYFSVPDGTLVCPFFNPLDSQSGLPWTGLEGMSMAAGHLVPGQPSQIHTHPLVHQATLVRVGRLRVRVKKRHSSLEEVDLAPGEGLLFDPGDLLQLIPITICDVLYVVSPAYVFDMVDGEVAYDDAVLLGRDWAALEAAGWTHPDLEDLAGIERMRAAALARIKARLTGQAL